MAGLDSYEPISPYIPYSLGGGSLGILTYHDADPAFADKAPLGFAGLDWTPPLAAKGNAGKKKRRKAKKAKAT